MIDAKTRALSQELLPECSSVLLKTSERDDALCYQARISAAASRTVKVHLHESSLLLDRVRLMGSLLVIVEASHAKFWGELRVMPAPDRLHHDTPTLILELFDRSETVACDQQLLPMT